MLKATFKKYILNFKQASGTSRGILKTKETFFIIVSDGNKIGYGECGLFRGLSIDDRTDYEDKLNWGCEKIHLETEFLLNQLLEFPSIQFGIEQALLSIKGNTPFELFQTEFTLKNAPISINGLVWMGSPDFMQKQIEEKLEQGFSTIKLKIGAIEFEQEIELLKSIRNRFSSKEIELRVDANGAFTPDNALDKLKRLSDFDLHSIEQPIKQGQVNEMADLCSRTPLDIALDEELIGVFDTHEKKKLIETIKPQYIILKPSLVGGIKGSSEWIDISEKNNIDWWITSALESNIGLNAIAQYTASLKTTMPQGLGTGGLFTNNFDSPLYINKGALLYNPSKTWKINI